MKFKSLKNYIAIPFFLLLFSCILVQCTQKEKIIYGALAFIDGVEILDIEPFQDSLLLIAGKNKQNQGFLYVYNTKTKKYFASQTTHVMYDIFLEDTVLWACGDSMSIIKSNDKGLTWNVYNNFNYFWDADKSHFRKLAIYNNTPIYAIGKKDMLQGNMYITNNSVTYPFKSIQMQTGINDMAIIDSSQVYVAAYGSIIRFTNNGKNKRFEQIGGHNFTSITYSGNKNIISTTFDGSIFTCELTDSVWKKVLNTSIEFKHIASDSYGNAIAIGNSNTIYISNDYGNHWHLEKYAFGKDVTCLTYANNLFYIGCKSGEIHTITRSQIE